MGDISVGYELGNILKVNKFLVYLDKHQLYNCIISTELVILLKRQEFIVLIEDANYEDDTTVWDLRLFDLQTYTVYFKPAVSNFQVREASY